MTDWLEIVGEFIHTGINFTFHPLTYFQYYESLLFYSEKFSQLYQRFEIGIGQVF